MYVFDLGLYYWRLITDFTLLCLLVWIFVIDLFVLGVGFLGVFDLDWLVLVIVWFGFAGVWVFGMTLHCCGFDVFVTFLLLCVCCFVCLFGLGLSFWFVFVIVVTLLLVIVF